VIQLICFFIITPTRCTNFTNLFWHETLHVSDSSSVHHQEFIHRSLSSSINHTGFLLLFLLILLLLLIHLLLPLLLLPLHFLLIPLLLLLFLIPFLHLLLLIHLLLLLALLLLIHLLLFLLPLLLPLPPLRLLLTRSVWHIIRPSIGDGKVQNLNQDCYSLRMTFVSSPIDTRPQETKCGKNLMVTEDLSVIMN